jgi:hypothetical protein
VSGQLRKARLRGRAGRQFLGPAWLCPGLFIAEKAWYRWLNRRGQRSRLNRDRFRDLLRGWETGSGYSTGVRVSERGDHAHEVRHGAGRRSADERVLAVRARGRRQQCMRSLPRYRQPIRARIRTSAHGRRDEKLIDGFTARRRSPLMIHEDVGCRDIGFVCAERHRSGTSWIASRSGSLRNQCGVRRIRCIHPSTHSAPLRCARSPYCSEPVIPAPSLRRQHRRQSGCTSVKAATSASQTERQ